MRETRGSFKQTARESPITQSASGCRSWQSPYMDDLVVFCADVGSVRSGNFGWACGSLPAGIAQDHDRSSPVHLAEMVAAQLRLGHQVALGFECPLFVPVPESADMLGSARPGEGNRAWSAGAGTGALATGLVQTAWVLAAIRRRVTDTALHLEWEPFVRAESGLLVWEAFVSAAAKGVSHVDDATIAVETFVRALPDPRAASTITAERPFSLAGAAAIWSGWLDDPHALHTQTLVIRA
jgi:hypothetical protein